MRTLTRDSVLTSHELARALHVHVKTVHRMAIPCCYISKRIKRYVWGDVLDALKDRVDVVTPARKRKGRAA